MGTIKTTNIEPIADNGTVTLGSSGDTFTVPSGVTVNMSSATQTGVGGTNTPHFEAYRSGTQAISNGVWTTILFNAEARDASSLYDTSNGRFTPTTAGKYFCYANVIGGNDGSSSLNYVLAKFFKNGSDYQTTSVFKQDSRGYPGANYTVSACHVIEFNGSSDYLEVKINMDTTVGTPDCVENSNFGAYKIIE